MHKDEAPDESGAVPMVSVRWDGGQGQGLMVQNDC